MTSLHECFARDPDSHASHRPVKIAVIGAGTIAQAAHLPALSRLDHLFDVAAICDLSAGRANWVANRSGAGVRATTRASDILDDPYLEAVLLATPGDHSELVRRALEAGKQKNKKKGITIT
jgi:predicted dehydrogenase